MPDNNCVFEHGNCWYATSESCDELDLDNSKKITNFLLRITEHETRHKPDGDIEVYYHLEITMENGTIKHGVVSAIQFNDLSCLAKLFGLDAYIADGCKSIVRNKIIDASRGFKRIDHYSSIGHTVIDNKPVFLTRNGAIGSTDKNSNIVVKPRDEIAFMDLPMPIKDKQQQVDNVNALLELESLVPEYPDPSVLLLSALAVSPLTTIKCLDPLTLGLLAKSGIGKTASALLAQACYGKDGGIEPAISWDSTEAAIRLTYTSMNGGVLLIDEATPRKSSSYDQDLCVKFDNTIRGFANKSPKSTALSKRQAAYPIIISTGEVLLNLIPSAHARVIYIRCREVDFEKLSHLQNQASQGVFAQVMSNYISYTLRHQSKIEALANELKPTYRKYFATKCTKKLAQRQPSQFATLLVGLKVFCKYLKSISWGSDEEIAALFMRYRDVLCKIANAQPAIVGSTPLPERVRNRILWMLRKHKVHVLATNGLTDPKILKSLGWLNGKPNGKCAGWWDAKTHQLLVKSDMLPADLLGTKFIEANGLPATTGAFVRKLSRLGIVVAPSSRDSESRLVSKAKILGKQVNFYRLNLTL